jgi:hypothetical protein
MLTSGLENITNMFETGEHTLGGWLGALTSLGFAIPMITAGVTGLGVAIAGSNTITALSTMLTKGHTAAEIESIAVNKLGLTVEAAKILAEKGEATSKGTLIALTIASKLAKIGETAADSGSVTAKLAHAAANWILNASMGPVLAITLLFVAALAAVVAIAAIVITVINGISDAYNKDAIAAEEARKQAEETANAYGKVKQELEDLKTALEDYNKAQNAILTLKEGTDEWR